MTSTARPFALGLFLSGLLFSPALGAASFAPAVRTTSVHEQPTPTLPASRAEAATPSRTMNVVVGQGSISLQGTVLALSGTQWIRVEDLSSEALAQVTAIRAEAGSSQSGTYWFVAPSLQQGPLFYELYTYQDGQRLSFRLPSLQNVITD